MCRLLWSLVLVVSASIPGLAQEKAAETVPEIQILFNARSDLRTFKWRETPVGGQPRIRDLPRHLRSNSPIVLRIIEPDSFRESYTVRFVTVDIHTAKLPDPLGKLILASTPTTSGLPVTSITKQGFVAETNEERKARLKAFNESLTKAPGLALDSPIHKLIASYQELEAKIDGFLGSSLDAKLLKQARTIAQDLVRITTGSPGSNASKRGLCAARIKEYDDSLGLTVKDPSGAVRTIRWNDALARVQHPDCEEMDSTAAAFAELALIPPALDDPALGERQKVLEDTGIIANTLAVFKARYSDARRFLVLYQAPDEILKRLNGLVEELNRFTDERIKMVDAKRAAMLSDLSEMFKQLAAAAELFSVVVDPKQVPTCIEKLVDSVPGDGVEITIEIEPKYGKDSPEKPAKVSRTARLPVFGRWAVDYSLGIIGHSLRPKTFITGADPDGDGPGQPPILDADSDRLDVGGAAMVHWYRTRPGGISWGPSIGLAADPVRYLAGISAVFGGTHPEKSRTRVFLTGGIAAGKLDRPNFALPREPNKEPKTTKKFLSGWFAALTANFGF